MSDNYNQFDNEKYENEESEFTSKKERKKYESKIARAYYKAKFDEKIGYRFKARKEYYKGKFKIPIKWFGYLSIVLILLFLYLNISDIIKGNQYEVKAEKYQNMTRKITPEYTGLSKNVDKQLSKVEQYNRSNSAGVIRAQNNLSDLFTYMFDYNDGEKYRKNYKKGMNLFKDKNADFIKDVYASGLDSDGENKIDALELSSSLEDVHIYSTHENDKDRKKLHLKAVVTYHSYMEGVSGKYTERTHQNIYDIKYDTSSNKITDMSKEATLDGYNEDTLVSE